VQAVAAKVEGLLEKSGNYRPFYSTKHAYCNRMHNRQVGLGMYKQGVPCIFDCMRLTTSQNSQASIKLFVNLYVETCKANFGNPCKVPYNRNNSLVG